MNTQGFKPRKMHGSLSMKLEKFQELYEEIMDEIRPRANNKELRSLSPNTFSRLVHENFAEQEIREEPVPKQSLYSDIM